MLGDFFLVVVHFKSKLIEIGKIVFILNLYKVSVILLPAHPASFAH